VLGVVQPQKGDTPHPHGARSGQTARRWRMQSRIRRVRRVSKVSRNRSVEQGFV
jgi:hypothetical protein